MRELAEVGPHQRATWEAPSGPVLAHGLKAGSDVGDQPAVRWEVFYDKALQLNFSRVDLFWFLGREAL
jgi:hypothetical protein